MAISRTLSDLQNAQASAERIVGLIETKPELYDKQDVIEKYGDLFQDMKENWEPLKGDVEFKDVTFYYKDNETILSHFNLKVKSGQSVALVGHTGSGKTTLVNLLSRFYEPKEGQILIDGIDYRERSIHWLHSRLGYVLQTPHLFSTTVMENIRYGRLNATDEEVMYAAKMVGVDDFVKHLDKGYQTSVGEGGNLLSVGQKQLISFARAILADPRILILDEATSSIDSESEMIIQEATEKLLSDRTSIIVAHRLSTIVNSDLIVMLDMGQIIEMGSHEELLNKRGAYFELYKNQFFKEKGKELEAVLE
jgi:ATP-binding cassette subfamily B protein